jgi:hypothetical protein
VIAHTIAVLQRHCAVVGREPAEIEVRVMYRNFAPDASSDDVVGAAEASAEVGVDTLIVGATGDDPAGWLETTFGPTIDRIHDLGR